MSVIVVWRSGTWSKDGGFHWVPREYHAKFSEAVRLHMERMIVVAGDKEHPADIIELNKEHPGTFREGSSMIATKTLVCDKIWRGERFWVQYRPYSTSQTPEGIKVVCELDGITKNYPHRADPEPPARPAAAPPARRKRKSNCTRLVRPVKKNTTKKTR